MPEALTLYNYYQNAATRQEEWYRTVLAGQRIGGKSAVHWVAKEAVNTIKSGMATVSTVEVMIWFSATAEGKTYLPPKQFAALPPGDVPRHWTLAKGHDHLFKGIIPEIVTPPNTITKLKKLYDDCITIKTVDTADFGNPGMRHWAVSGA